MYITSFWYWTRSLAWIGRQPSKLEIGGSNTTRFVWRWDASPRVRHTFLSPPCFLIIKRFLLLIFFKQCFLVSYQNTCFLTSFMLIILLIKKFSARIESNKEFFSGRPEIVWVVGWWLYFIIELDQFYFLGLFSLKDKIIL